MTASSRRFLAERLYQVFLQFQRRRAVQRHVVAKERVSLLAVRILGYLQLSPGANAADLGRVWNAERSVVSRTLRKLERRGFLNRSKGDDGRKRLLNLSPEGMALIREVDAELTKIINESLAGLNPAQRSRLTAYLLRFAQRLAQTSAPGTSVRQRPSEHPVNFALMQISMSGGMYGGRFFGTSMTVQQAQLLDVVGLHQEGIDIASLSRETALEQSLVSRTVSRMVRLGLLDRRPSEKDRRQSLVTDTSHGNRQLKDHCHKVARHFEHALADMPVSSIKDLCSLLEQAAHGAPLQHSGVIQERIEVRRLFRIEDRAVARAFLVEQAVRHQQHFELPEALASKGGLTYGLFINNQLGGVCDCLRQGTHWKVQRFTIASELQTDFLQKRFATACKEQCANDFGKGALLFH